MTEIHGHDWKLDIPEDWDSHQEDEYLIVFEPNGVGELTITGMVTDEEVSAEDLREFAADSLDAGHAVEDVELGAFVGFTLSYVEQGDFWREWYLRAGSIALFATYNCPRKDRNEDEEETVEGILDTLQLGQ